jgi:hypothetical protein
MVHTGLSFSQLKKNPDKIIVPPDVPYPSTPPFSRHIRTVNKQLKTHLVYAGIHDICPSTFSFINKLTVDGVTYYGMSPRTKAYAEKYPNEKKGVGFIYFVKHRHLNPELSKLLTDKKIGVTKNIKMRMHSLTLGPIDLEILKVWEMEINYAHKLEKIIHSCLQDKHLVGEWFNDPNNTLMGELLSIMESKNVRDVTHSYMFKQTKLKKSVVLNMTEEELSHIKVIKGTFLKEKGEFFNFKKDTNNNVTCSFKYEEYNEERLKKYKKGIRIKQYDIRFD